MGLGGRAASIMADKEGLPSVKEGRFRWAALTCGLVCLMSGLVPVLVKASSIIVPDAFPTIQAGLSSAADTVFVRGGTYAEAPVIARQVALLGMPGEAPPVLDSLWILSAPGYFPLMRVGGMRFSRRIYIDNNEDVSFIAIEHCDLLAGVSDISRYPATARMTLRQCRIIGDADLTAEGPARLTPAWWKVN